MFSPVSLPAVAALSCALIVCIALVWAVTRGRRGGRGDDDLLARLYVMVERDGARQAETERALTARLEQVRHELAERLGALALSQSRAQGEARLAQETALRDMAQQTAAQLETIRAAVNEQLHKAVERQMQTSFQRVIEQFSAMQKAMGEVTAMTAQIGDLKRLFSNVKTRGGWGEAQLGAILDDVLPAGAYGRNMKLGDGREVVEFAVRMPVRGGGAQWLAIDSKFPLEAYERLLDAAERGDAEGERTARRSLEAAMRMESRKIAAKYITPPVTVDFAVLYLPTDGLYAEIARVPGLIDEIGRTSRVIVMGPALMPAMLRTIHLGYVTLALEERTDAIARLLGQTRQEMVRMDTVLDRLARNASAMSTSIEEARTRTRVLGQKLRGLDAVEEAPATRGRPGGAGAEFQTDFSVGDDGDASCMAP
ncbi:DNA recombination protein RmuC [Ameyamaea chiangmaiensis]|uniref:DNA recombination protein RmuC homolog n=1 Tax=Ameyamaea chiangmaiensis TaxID=442969 RepID=A0A850P357_9PROT|nr:DNA recombination protein RmuC [Ameyamaea chiangmaiensis]MBS4074162.1 DNA recombination protein RmuC [Ameyamaea chiangmaiensis]NVN39105.1 DNA recombination protein RmuC [Ameyamaea chiangmaiensis]